MNWLLLIQIATWVIVGALTVFLGLTIAMWMTL
jgi:uncharacterized membrane protein